MVTNNNISKDTVLHKGMVPAQKALELVLQDAAPVGITHCILENASGRVLADDLISKRTQPPFAASAMDGYAVRAEDLATGETVLTLIGESAAGHPFKGKLSVGQCIRIFTGAPVPAGADTVIIQENVQACAEKIKILEPAPKGKFVRPAGLDFSKGQMLLQKGTIIDPQNLSLCASMDFPAIPVYSKPKVAILATGDELVLPGESTNDGQIIASNTFGISAIAKEAGGEVSNLGIAEDSLEALKESIGKALENGADLIVTSGGASVGDHDLVKPVMERLGFVFSFIKIAMRPGKPVIFGRATIDGIERRFLGLAGNPVSSLVSSHIFMKPLIRLLGGYPAETIKPIGAVLASDLSANGDREDYMRAIAEKSSDGELKIRPFEKQDSSMLATLSRADCLVVRPVHAPPAQAGDRVNVILLRDV